MRILALDNCIFTQREMCYMSKTYLFSPIGNTDPIKYFYDGSMLHICRYYKPDVVILYLSHEMILHHEKDNRYVRSIELLGEKLGILLKCGSSGMNRWWMYSSMTCFIMRSEESLRI